MIALDTETTGVDLYHGAQPFFVTVCREDGTVSYWQWDVDPLTRKVHVPPEDARAIKRLLATVHGWSLMSPEVAERHNFIAQNGKFDCAALASVGIDNWPWQSCDDTLIAAHLLASNQPHDLTSLALHYLGVDIQPYEDRLRDGCIAARRLAKKHFPNWRLAREGEPDMPSVKGGSDRSKRGAESEKPWKADSWLPRQLALKIGPPDFPADHPWLMVLKDYANTDSSATLALWRVLRDELTRRGLWKIYLERRKLMQLAYRMERQGVTISGNRLAELETDFCEDSAGLNNVCVHIARSFGYDLTLPKGGRNNSLNRFIFDILNLPHLKRTDKGNPSMDRHVLEAWQLTLEQRSKELAFVNALVSKRRIDTALSYMGAYQRFALPLGGVPYEGSHPNEGRTGSLPAAKWFVLHPSLNPCGTDTLRCSSANPNEQNISKQKGHNLRYCFGPAPGREWWSLDGKNLELRIPAYEADETEMIALFDNPDEPPYYGSNHLLNFHTVYPDIWESELGKVCNDPMCCAGKVVGSEIIGPHCKKQFESTWYQYAKNGGFAVQYGAIEKIGGAGTADKAFHRPGSHAKLKTRFQRIHGPGGLNERMIAFARKHGYVETIPDRSVDSTRGYPLMVTRTEFGGVLPTVPLNYHVQGTACWWMARAMVRCQAQLDQWRKEDGFDGFITMQIHDELVFDLPAQPNHGNLPRIRILQRLMEQGGKDIGVPTPVSVEYHASNWAEGEEV